MVAFVHSDDNKLTWKDIPNSNFAITRTLTYEVGNKIKFEIHKGNILPNIVHEAQNNSATIQL